jgi:transcriptional regulator with XRE-family HTH domain
MIHRALRLLRTYHNFKQKDLAARLDLSPSHLSEIEKGVKPVTYELLERYSAVFKIPVSSIALFAEATDRAPQRPAVRKISEKALRLLEWLDTITEIDNDSADDRSPA